MYNQILHILQELHRDHPTYNMGRHLATALDGYGDIWGITDKELLFSLSKYQAQLELDVPHADESEIDEIIKDAENLDTILKEEEEEEEDQY